MKNELLLINTKRGKSEVTLFGTSKRLCKTEQSTTENSEQFWDYKLYKIVQVFRFNVKWKVEYVWIYEGDHEKS